jgi:hypothetical protein
MPTNPERRLLARGIGRHSRRCGAALWAAPLGCGAPSRLPSESRSFSAPRGAGARRRAEGQTRVTALSPGGLRPVPPPRAVRRAGHRLRPGPRGAVRPATPALPGTARREVRPGARRRVPTTTGEQRAADRRPAHPQVEVQAFPRARIPTIRSSARAWAGPAAAIPSKTEAEVTTQSIAAGVRRRRTALRLGRSTAAPWAPAARAEDSTRFRSKKPKS